jgi:hypothetical protein
MFLWLFDASNHCEDMADDAIEREDYREAGIYRHAALLLDGLSDGLLEESS